MTSTATKEIEYPGRNCANFERRIASAGPDWLAPIDPGRVRATSKRFGASGLRASRPTRTGAIPVSLRSRCKHSPSATGAMQRSSRRRDASPDRSDCNLGRGHRTVTSVAKHSAIAPSSVAHSDRDSRLRGPGSGTASTDSGRALSGCDPGPPGPELEGATRSFR